MKKFRVEYLRVKRGGIIGDTVLTDNIIKIIYAKDEEQAKLLAENKSNRPVVSIEELKEEDEQVQD